MNPISSPGGAIALASILLLCASAPALAHDGHNNKEEALQELPDNEARSIEHDTAPRFAELEHESTAHQHGTHATAAPDAGDAGDAGESSLPKPLAWLGKFHPPLTHFPIALILAAALAELMFLRTAAPGYRHALLFCVRIGAATAVLAAGLGWLFAGFRIADDEWVMTAHRWAGSAVALLSLWLLILAERLVGESPADASTRFRAVLFSTAALVGATGFLGGALLYGLDHYAW